MSSLSVTIIKIVEDAQMPRQQTEGSSGYDLHAYLPEGPVLLPPGQRQLLGTGIKLAFEQGLEAQIRPRSGLAFKYGITVLNSPGTIDSDYRGEIKVLLINHGNEPVVLQHGERIAQLVFQAVPKTELILELKELPPTNRGAGGFGSTGRD